MQRFFLEKTISKLGYIAEQITAGGAEDGVAQTGSIQTRVADALTVDSVAKTANYDAVAYVANLAATLAEDETAKFDIVLQTSDSATFASGIKYLTEEWDLEDDTTNAVTATATLTGGTGGSTESETLSLKVLLDSCLTYVRPVVTCTLSADDTDTAILSIVGIFGDSQNQALDVINAPSIDE